MQPDQPSRLSAAPAGEPSAPDQWRIADLIDFEYFLQQDETLLRERPAARRELAERDRNIYLVRIQGMLGKRCQQHSHSHRRLALLHWLGVRRAGEGQQAQALLPGAAFAAANRLALVVLLIFGFLAGVGLTSTLLSYDGHRPVSISWYLFLLVIVQMLMVIATILLLNWRRFAGRFTGLRTPLPGGIVKPLLLLLADWLQRQRLAGLPEEAGERAAAARGLLGSRFTLYGELSFLPLLTLGQVFAVAFNLGVVLTTLMLESFTDLAFGWGTSLALDPQTIHTLVRLMATPWRWLWGEGVGYPSLEQIVGSRIYLEHWASFVPGLRPDPGDLRSWRWFLLLSVIAYGLLPRLVLLVMSLLRQRLALRKLDFGHGRGQALYARLVTPCVDMKSTAATGSGVEMPIPQRMEGEQERRLLRPAGARAARRHWREPPPDALHSDVPPATPADAGQRAPVPADDPLPPERPGTEVLSVADAGDEIAESSQSVSESVVRVRPSEPRADDALDTFAANRVERSVPESAAAEAAPAPAEASIERFSSESCLLLAHVDIDDLLDQAQYDRLHRLVLHLTGWQVGAVGPIGAGSAMTEAALNRIEVSGWDGGAPRVVLLLDGSQPPITETLLMLRQLRASCGERASIVLALTGDADEDDPLPVLADFDYRDWQRKIDQLSDPYLRLEMLVPPSDSHEYGEDQ